MIHVAIVDDHPAIREWFSQAVSQTPELELSCAEHSIEAFECRVQALRRAGAAEPDVVLLDLSLPEGDRGGAEGVAYLVDRGFTILVFTSSEARDAVVAAVAAGARGYVTKATPTREIVTAVQRIAAGHDYISATLASYLVRASRERTAPRVLLTDREKQILVCVAQGDTDQEIADALRISVRTVRSHLDNIGCKVGNRKRAALASHAERIGLRP